MFHVRDHDGPRVRIWTDEMDAYGQFNVVSFKDIEELHELLGKLGLGQITVHHCQTQDECKCRPHSYGTPLNV